jgi:hypothetical protein
MSIVYRYGRKSQGLEIQPIHIQWQNEKSFLFVADNDGKPIFRPLSWRLSHGATPQNVPGLLLMECGLFYWEKTLFIAFYSLKGSF